MRRLGAFLNQHGIKIKKSYSSALNDPGLLADSEFPKLKGKKPSKYSDEMIGFRGAEPDPRSGGAAVPKNPGLTVHRLRAGRCFQLTHR